MKHALSLAMLFVMGQLAFWPASPVAAQSTSPSVEAIVGWGNPVTYLPVSDRDDYKAVAAGSHHNLALKRDGTVVAWGWNNYAQCRVPAGLSGVTAIAAGDSHSLALKGDGTVVAWGDNGSGQSSVPAGLSGVVAVAAGGSHSLALKNDGTVVAWGDDSSGQSVVPTGLSGVIAIAAGGWHSLALKSDGTVVAWGDNSYGQSGVPTGLSGVIAVAAGGSHSLALKSDGTVVAWGDNGYGQSSVPAGLAGVTAIAAGGWHSLALKSDGTVVAWGDNSSGQSSVPAGLSGVIAVAAGWGHSLGLKADGTVVAWGDNGYGQSSVPAGLAGVTAIAAGWGHSLALKRDGTVVAWGDNGYGQSSVPAGLAGVTAIAAGTNHNLALKGDGTVVAWGDNSSGQCRVPAGLSGVTAIAASWGHSLALKGDGTVVAWGSNWAGQSSVPAGLSNVTAIAAGWGHSLALKRDGTVVAWGYNGQGQCSVPAGLSGVTAIAAGCYHNLALKADGTVVAWAHDQYGQSSVPAGLSGVAAIAAGWNHNLALKNDGTVVAWGDSSYGQSTVPAGLGGVIAIAAGHRHSLALKTASPANRPPLANADSAVTNVNAAVMIDVLANDRDPDGDAIALTDVTQGVNGTVEITADGKKVTYTPKPDYSGSDSFAYGISDGREGTAVGSVTVTIKPINNAPVAQADSYSTDEDTPLTIAAPGVLGNDSDADGEALKAVLREGPAHGTLALNADGSFTYTPAANYHGPDAFTYLAQDTSGAFSASTTVALTVNSVNDVPVAQADSYSLDEDTPLTIAAPGVLANDSDADGEALKAVLLSRTTHGLLALSEDGSFSYTPEANYNGPDSFSYKANDGQADSPPVTVTITVKPVNDLPVAQAQAVSLEEDTPQAITLVATDAEGEALTYTIEVRPAHGTLSGQAPNLTYTPEANYNGSDSFAFKANDGKADSNMATVAITVKPVNDVPVAQADSYSTDEDTVLSIAAPGLLGNDTDADGDALKAILLSRPTHGLLAFSEDGSFSYIPEANYNGSDSFTYMANDGQADSPPVTVAITIKAVNVPPSAYAGETYLAEKVGGTASVTLSGAAASDLDGDALTYHWTCDAPGAIFDNDTALRPTLTFDASGYPFAEYTLTLEVDDGQARTRATTTVRAIDTQKPMITLLGDNPLTLEGGMPFSDPGATAQDAADGSVQVTVSGAVDTAQVGRYTLTYTATDRAGNVASASRTVQVVDTRAPVITLNGADPIYLECRAETYSEPGATASDAVDGTVAVIPSGTVDANTPGSYTITYRASDKAGHTATATRTVIVGDTTAPIITLNGANPLTHEGGTPFSDPGATASDAVDGTVAVTADASAVKPNVPGSYTITYRARDAAGNTAQATRTVQVVDTQGPVITINGANPLRHEGGTPFSDPGATASDAVDGRVAVTVSGSVDVAKVGQYTLTYSARDAAGHSATATRTVEVVDTRAPVITLNGANPLMHEGGTPFSDPGATASDAIDGTVAVTADTSAVKPNVPGSYTITYSTRDTAGNTATASRTVQVGDTTAPSITINGANPLTHEGGTPFTDPGATVIDACDPHVAIKVSGLVNAAVPGTYILTYSATDASGNVASATRTVNVVDTTAPTITLIGDQTLSHEGGMPFTDPGATASDAVDGTVAVTVSGSVDVATIGQYTLTYRASDKAGNAASVNRTIRIIDTTAPKITITGANPLTHEGGTAFSDPGATASDAVDGNVAVTADTSAVKPSVPGDYTITYTAIDASGNKHTAIRAVNVVDTTAPTITLSGDNPLMLAVGGTYTEPGATAHDLVDGNFPATASGAVDANTPGSYIITYRASDKAGHTATATRTVIVGDTTAPIITLNGANPLTHESGTPFSDPGATASDAVDGTVAVTADASAVKPNMPGSYTITYRARDAAGNTAQATRTVQVVDTQGPVITINGANPLRHEGGTPFSDPGATASDAVDGRVAVTVSGSVDVAKVGQYTLTYSARDAAGHSATATRTVEVVDTTEPTITLNGANPLTLAFGATYTEPGAVAHDLVDGDFPATPSGTVNTAIAGSYTITYRASDKAGNAAQAVTRTVIVQPEAASIIVSAPTNGAAWPQVSTQTIRWTSRNVTGNVGLAVSTNGGTTWQTIASSTANDGNQNWRVNQSPSTNCLIRVQSVSNPAIFGLSGVFTITPVGSSLNVTAPTGSSVWGIGSNATISWTRNRVPGTVSVALSRDDGATWQTIATGLSGSSYTYPVSGPATTNARVRVSSTTYPALSSTSARFTIATSSITVTSPAAGVVWRRGTTYNITWVSMGLSATSGVNIQASADGGATWTTFIANTPNDGRQSWTVPNAVPRNTQVRIRIVSVQYNTISGQSGQFTIR